MWEGLFNILGPEFANTIDGYLEECMLRFLKNMGLIPANAKVQELGTAYREIREKYGYRWVRPDDQIFGGTAVTYTAAYASGAAAQNVLAAAATTRVPNGQAIVHIGWYSSVYYGEDGYLQVLVNTQKKIEIPQRIVWEQTKPPHALFPLSSTIFLKENDLVQWQLRQQTGLAITNVTYPIAAIFGTLAQIGLN